MKSNTLCCWSLLVWGWVSVGAAGAQVRLPLLRLPTGHPTPCLPENPSRTSYRADDIILCSLLSETKRAYGFYYQDGVCDLVTEGEGLGMDSGRMVFKTYEILPQSQSLQEVAQSRPTHASPHYNDYLPEHAVDGQVDNKYSINRPEDVMYHSKNHEVYPWWMVDLGTPRTVHCITIVTRRDCCFLRFHDIEVRVGNTFTNSNDLTSNTLFSTYKGPYDIKYGNLTCSRSEGVSGRYVSIQRVTPENHVLQLVEVQVFAAPLQ